MDGIGRNWLPGRRMRAIAGVFVGAVLAGCAIDTTSLGDVLDAADRQQIANTTQHALENNKTGESSNWTNPASGHRGTVTPTRTYTARSGANCRELQQTVAIDARTTIAYDTACRRADGVWYSVNYDSLVAAAAGARPYRAGYDDWSPGYPYYGYRYPYYRYGYDYPYYGYGDPYYGYRYPGYGYGYSGFGFRYGYGRWRRH